MDALTRRQFDRAMFAKDRTLAIRVGDYASRDIKEASFEYGYIKGDTYKPGGTCAGSGKITFTSIITTFNKLDILHPEIGLLVGNSYQWVKMGEYFINDIEIDRNRNTTTLELMDGMFKLNREYVTDLRFPAEVREVIQEICLKTGIELANDYFGISAMRYHVEQVPEGKKLSFRDMLSSMTQMIGMSCFFNREGKMEIRDLTESNITINADSYFLHGLTKSEIEYQIAGITCKTDKKSLTVGMKTGRSLELDNVFMTQSALNDLYYKLKNLTYYPYNLNYQGHLLLEVGQWVTIQTNKKETFKVPVLSQSFTFKGGLRGRISADSKAGNDTQYSYEGTITKQIKQQDGIEAKIQAQIEAADAAFEAEFEKRKKEIDDGIELAKAKAEEVKQDISNEIDKRFQNFDNASIQEARRKVEEALRSAGASASLAQEAKTIADQASAKMNQFKQESSKAQRDLSENVNRFKSELQQSLAGKADNATVEQTERALREKFESLSTDTIGKINAAKTEFEKTVQGLSTKITKVETYVNNDGQRQDDLKRYAREESASQARAVREDVTRDFVGKNTFQESVQGVERRLESFSLGTSGNLLKNSNEGFYNQHDKRYRLVETLQANQTYTLVTKYWRGENATGHTFYDGVGNWQRLTYNRAIDAWMVQFTPTQKIPAGTEITLSSDPYESKGNMHWATLVRGAIPLIHWQPARGDVEEGVTQKLAEYKETVDGRFATISSQLDNKASQSDFQRVKETSQLYERIIGRNENDIADKVARMALTNQLFQVEVSKYSRQGGPNLIKNSGNPQDNKNWGYWEIGQNPAIKTGTHPFFYNQKRKLFFFENNTREVVPVSTIRFPLKRNTSYTVSLTVFNTLNMKGANIFFLGRKSGENQAFTRVVTLVENVKFSSDEAVRKNYTFNSGECDEGFIRIDNNGTTDNNVAILLFGDVDVYEGTTIRPWQPSPEDANEAVRTVQTQLAGSWAVQNINSAGDIISGLNLGANGHNRLDGKLTHITGETLIDNAVIKSAMIDKLKTANFESGSVTTKILDAEAVTADKVRFDNAFIRKMITNEAFIEQLTSKRIFATKVESVVSSSTFLEAYQGRIGGFTLGQFDQGGGRWISGVNQFSVGMGNGAGYGVRTAFWANWGNNWNYAGPKAWNVNTDGKMYCRNEVGFYDQVDFSNSSRANFYGTTTFSRSPIFSNGIELGDKDVFGDGWNPKGGRNAVVWWNQVGSGSVKYWMEQKSDRRLKENITDTAVKALDKINRLRMVAFDFIESKKHEEIGLIAQEAETIVPRIVSRDPENPDGYLHIDYTALVPYLIKAIQELNQKIEKMEKTIA